MRRYFFPACMGYVTHMDERFLAMPTIQSGPQDQKSVIFSHSAISLNQLKRNSKNTANIFLTFRNGQNISLSEYNVYFLKCCIP